MAFYYKEKNKHKKPLFTEFYETKPASQLSTCLMFTVVSSANPIRAHKLRFKYVLKKNFFYLIHHFKIQAQSGGGAETAHFPLARATNTHLLRKADNHRHCDELQ